MAGGAPGEELNFSLAAEEEREGGRTRSGIGAERPESFSENHKEYRDGRTGKGSGDGQPFVD